VDTKFIFSGEFKYIELEIQKQNILQYIYFYNTKPSQRASFESDARVEARRDDGGDRCARRKGGCV